MTKLIPFVYNRIHILHQNINGLLGKSELLYVQIDELVEKNITLDVLCITEHNMVSNDLCFLNIPNYIIASSYTRNTRRGGSCILVRNNHLFTEIKDIKEFCTTGILECCAIELIEHKIIIIAIYRPPSKCSQSQFFF